MKKRIFQIFAVLMIIGLLAGTLSPVLLQLISTTNSSDDTNQDPNIIQAEPSEETVD